MHKWHDKAVAVKLQTKLVEREREITKITLKRVRASHAPTVVPPVGSTAPPHIPHMNVDLRVTKKVNRYSHLLGMSLAVGSTKDEIGVASVEIKDGKCAHSSDKIARIVITYMAGDLEGHTVMGA